MTEKLLNAVLAGDHRAVSQALKQGADPNSADGDSTALCHAAFDGNVRIVKALIAAGADPDRADAGGFLPLHLAASRNHAAVVTGLLDGGAQVDLRGKEDGTALHVAAAEGAEKSTAALIAGGINVQAADEHGAPGLHYAAMHGHRKVIKLLILAGAQINTQDGGGRTALLHALDGMQRHLVAEWQMAGTKNGRECTFRIENGDFTCQLSGEDYKVGVPLAVERKLSSAHCPPHRTYLDCRDVVGDLLKFEADIQIADQSERTALHRVCELGEAKMFNKLLKLGADGEARDRDGCAPSHEVAYCARPSFLQRAKLGALDFSVTDDDGNTPIHHLAISGSLAVARDFWRVCNGPYLVVNTAGKYPSTLAREAGHSELADFLEAKELGEQAARLSKKSWPAAEVLANLRTGTHFIHAMPWEAPERKTTLRVHLLTCDRWVTAHVQSDTGELVPDKLTIKPIEHFEEAIRNPDHGGQVDLAMLPSSALPTGAIECLTQLVSERMKVLETIRGGRHWLVDSQYAQIAYHERAGWVYVSVKGGKATRCSACDEERAAGCGSSPELIPQESLAYINQCASRFSDDLTTFREGESMFATLGSRGRRRAFITIDSTVVSFLFDYGEFKEARFNGNPRGLARDALWVRANEPSAGKFEKFPKHTIEAVDMVRRAAKGDYEQLVQWVCQGRVVLAAYRHPNFSSIEVSGSDGVARFEGKDVTAELLNELIGTRGKLALLTFQ